MDSMTPEAMWGLGLLVGLSLYAVRLIGRCAFRVEEGHVAVLSSFGAVERADGQLRTFGPGLHWRWPWQRSTVVAVMEQNLDLSGKEGGRTAMADDGTVLRFDSILRYVPLERELYTFLFGMRKPLEHITWLFTCLLRNEIANFKTTEVASGTALQTPGPSFDFSTHAGSYALIRRERKRLNSVIEKVAAAQIGERYGVQFNAVDLTDVLPPDELADALNAVIHAQTEAETDFFRAQADCQQRVLAAERGVEIARARAAAAATEIDHIGRHLGELERGGTLDDYVKRRRAEILSESRTVYLKERA
jgi:regulator of protease activity HflC (stomatin/prohibitin superfamily)